jgi:YesN/AraC family two-component response regulator
MTSLHVLFVDDEQAILDGLRNSLRKERKRWEMTFALGGQQALEEMKKTPADVVITDMRMPGMDGAELLRHIQRDFPAAARIVLSGQAEREAIMRALPVTHQFLPCERCP